MAGKSVGQSGKAQLRVFVSSVQKELEDERVIVQNLIQTDSFLSVHCTPVLYEYEPASPDKATRGCIEALESCQVYILIVWQEYGTPVGVLSMTHQEYRRARDLSFPVLAFIKGDRHTKREPATEALLTEVETDGLKYKRFGNVIELQKEVRAALVKLLEERFGIAPSTDENTVAEQTIEATSPFESQPMTRISWQDLDHDVVRRLVAASEAKTPDQFSDGDLLTGASLRGLVWRDPQSGQHFATAAGIVLLARDPSAVFPQCRILADAYRSAEPDGDPQDHEDIRGPMPLAVDRAIAFIDRNTRHPMKVVGLNRIRLDEYPAESLREALVNAVAHRQYEDGGRKILLDVFANRVVLSSPGLPPAPITIDKLRKGKYKPCSRNPVLAQCLSFFHRIEERGSGFRRMRDHMLNHGLDQPILGSDTGYFQVTFPGPGNDIDRLKMPASTPGLLVTPAIEAQLNERQKKILTHVLETGDVTRRWCVTELAVVNDTAGRDIKGLVEHDLLVAIGKGRSVRYVLCPRRESTDKRPTE